MGLFLMGAVDLRDDHMMADQQPCFGPERSEMPNSFSRSRMHNEISRPCGGRFGEQVAGNVDKGEAPTLLRERLEIRFDQNLHGLLARIDLDTNGRVAE